jgi:biotin transport system substrate-specific component
MRNSPAAPSPTRRLGADAASPMRLLLQLGLVLLGTALLTLSAKVQIPFWPVPVTMQTAVVMLLGVVAGPRLAVLTVGAYLLQGLAGLPVFAGMAAGPAYLLGPTGGYLLGFMLAAVISGLVVERARGWAGLAAGFCLATVSIYVLGAGWLAQFVGFGQAIELGVMPFLPGDALKLALVTAVAIAIRQAARAEA